MLPSVDQGLMKRMGVCAKGMHEGCNLHKIGPRPDNVQDLHRNFSVTDKINCRIRIIRENAAKGDKQALQAINFA
jgi:hypothetical protein